MSRPKTEKKEEKKKKIGKARAVTSNEFEPPKYIRVSNEKQHKLAFRYDYIYSRIYTIVRCTVRRQQQRRRQQHVSSWVVDKTTKNP